MDESTYRTVFTEFVNGYWGAFHEALEAQSVNPRMLADPLFEAVADAHRSFAAIRDGVDPSVERLGRLWQHVADRRKVTFEAPLSAREVAQARKELKTIYETLVAQGHAYPESASEIVSHAIHGTPTTPLRVDAAR